MRGLDYLATVSTAALLVACSSARAPEPVAEPARVPAKVTMASRETCARDPGEPKALAVCNLESPGSFLLIKNEADAEVEVLTRVDVELEDESDAWRQLYRF
jgi:hypothetical protein